MLTRMVPGGYGGLMMVPQRTAGVSFASMQKTDRKLPVVHADPLGAGTLTIGPRPLVVSVNAGP
jgi:hypothetical protein